MINEERAPRKELLSAAKGCPETREFELEIAQEYLTLHPCNNVLL